MVETAAHATMLIEDYVRLVAPTDRMPDDIRPVLFGLFGEVGGIMTAAKKYHREGPVFVGYRRMVEEEFGDCQDFRVWAGIMGKKESHYVSTQGAGDPG
jgi:hypothetical protein